jgi:hypothetical protein
VGSYNVVSEMRRRWRDRRPHHLIEYVEEGCFLSFGHGLAWRCMMTGGCYTALIPLNLFIAWGRRVFYWLRFQGPGGALWLDDKLREAYHLGCRETHAKYN